MWRKRKPSKSRFVSNQNRAGGFRKAVLIQDLLDEVARWVRATVKSVVVPELGRPLAFVSPVPDGSHAAQPFPVREISSPPRAKMKPATSSAKTVESRDLPPSTYIVTCCLVWNKALPIAVAICRETLKRSRVRFPVAKTVDNATVWA